MASAFLSWFTLDAIFQLFVSYTFNQLANHLFKQILNSESIEKKLIDCKSWDDLKKASSGVLTAIDCCNKGYWGIAKEELRSARGDYRNAYNYFSRKDNFEDNLTTVHCDLLLGICSGFVGDWESNSYHLDRGKNNLGIAIEKEKQKINLKRDKGNRNVKTLWGVNFFLSGATVTTGVVVSPITVSVFALSPVVFGLSFLDQTLHDNTRVEKRILSYKIPGHQYSVRQLKEFLDLLS